MCATCYLPQLLLCQLDNLFLVFHSDSPFFELLYVHDEVIIEADPKVSLEAIYEQMGRTPPWAEGLILRADGYTTPYYKKD